MSRAHPNAVDLCAGAGGWSVGAESVGFQSRAAFEIDPVARATYRANIAEGHETAVFGKDITACDPTVVPESDDIQAIFGGPPCQPFSSARGESFAGDVQETVLYGVSEWVAELEPAVVALENVSGLKQDNRHVLVAVRQRLEDIGYAVGVITLNAADFGVPQERERLFILGIRGDLEPPAKWEPTAVRSASGGQTTFANLCRGLDSYYTAGEALEELPAPLSAQWPGDDPVHLTPPGDARRYVDPRTTPTWVRRTADGYEAGGIDGDMLMPPNHVAPDHAREKREKYANWELGYCGGRTTDRRLHPDEPAPTMTFSQGTPPIHYTGTSPESEGALADVRRLTPREVAKIQTFPDSFAFGGTRTDQYRQAANAVPPLLGAHVADHLLQTVAEPLGFEHLYNTDTTEQPPDSIQTGSVA